MVEICAFTNFDIFWQIYLVNYIAVDVHTEGMWWMEEGVLKFATYILADEGSDVINVWSQTRCGFFYKFLLLLFIIPAFTLK